MSHLTVRQEGDLIEISRGGISIQVKFPEEANSTPEVSAPNPRASAKPAPDGAVLDLPPLELKGRAKVKPHRPNTRRAKVITMLKGKGATLDEVMAETKWSRNDAREAIRQINRDLGYGIHERDGVIKIDGN